MCFLTNPITSGIFLSFHQFLYLEPVATKLLVRGILFLTYLISVLKIVVTKPLAPRILLSTSSTFFSKFYLSVLYIFMSIKIAASGILFCKLFTFIFSLLNFVLLTTSLFTVSLKFFNSIGIVFNLLTSKSNTFVFKLLKPVQTLTKMFSLSISAFRTTKSLSAAKLDVSAPVPLFNSFSVAKPI